MWHATRRRRRAVLAAVLATAALVTAGQVHARPPPSGDCWRRPVDAPISDPFRAPTCRWCAGNRGVEFGARRGQTVRAVAAGTVAFSGAVAGVGYVVVRHADGRRVTYGNVVDVGLRRGDVVIRRAVVGRAAGPVHLGLRDGDRYVDPTPLLGTLVRRPRLLPTDGTAPRPGPPPVLRCRRAGPIRRRRGYADPPVHRPVDRSDKHSHPSSLRSPRAPGRVRKPQGA